MDEQGFFLQALYYLAAAVISVPIAKRLGLGSVLGYLLAGIIIGPFILGLIGEEGEDVMHFAEFGVVMMLFLIGLELRPDLLWQMRRAIFGLGFLQMALTTIIIGGIAIILGQTIAQSFAIGMILALSSTAIILQTLVEKGQMKTRVGKSAFSVLLFQDIAVIPILAILPILASASIHNHATNHHEKISTFAGLEVTGWVQFVLVIIVITGIGISGRYLAKYVFRIIAKTGLREIFTATALLLVIAISVAMEWVGLSPALGAFLGGVVLAENEYRHELEANIEPFKGLLLAIFFIAVGASIDFKLLIEKPHIILGLLALLIIVKILILLVVGRLFGLRKGKGMLFSLALAQGGEFAFVLISISLQNNVFSTETGGILLLVVALSMALTPLLLLINERIIQPAAKKSVRELEADHIEEIGNDVIIAGFGRFGISLGRMLIANGISTTILDDNPDNIRVLRKLGIKVYYGDASRHDLLHAAGCDDAKVLVLAMNNQEKSLQIVDYIRKTYPNLKLVVRSVSKKHGYELLKRGIRDFVPDMFHSSLEAGIKVLIDLGYNPYQATRAARIFREHDREVQQELYVHYEEDEQKYISETRRFAAELEELLKTENEQCIHESDKAWDVEGRIEEARGKEEGER